MNKTHRLMVLASFIAIGVGLATVRGITSSTSNSPVLPPDKQQILDREEQARADARANANGAQASPARTMPPLRSVDTGPVKAMGIEEGGSPWPQSYLIKDNWFGVDTIAYSGGLADNPNQGVVLVARRAAYPELLGVFKTDNAEGELRMQTVVNGQLLLVTPLGTHYDFDLRSHVLKRE